MLCHGLPCLRLLWAHATRTRSTGLSVSQSTTRVRPPARRKHANDGRGGETREKKSFGCRPGRTAQRVTPARASRADVRDKVLRSVRQRSTRLHHTPRSLNTLAWRSSSPAREEQPSDTAEDGAPRPARLARDPHSPHSLHPEGAASSLCAPYVLVPDVARLRQTLRLRARLRGYDAQCV